MYRSAISTALVCLAAFPAFAQTGFTKKTTPLTTYPTSSMQPADFNRDGHMDVLMPGWPQFTVAINGGGGNFTHQIQTISSGDASSNGILGPAAIADFNGDGYPDIAVCSSRNNGNFLETFVNHGGQSFTVSQTFPLSAPCGGITAIDVNHDGKIDVVAGLGDAVSNTGSRVVTFENVGTNGSESFKPLATQAVTLSDPQKPSSTCTLTNLAGADFQGSGRYDLVVLATCVPTDSPFSYGAAYYGRDNADGTFALSFLVDLPGAGAMQLFDANHDLKPDLLLTLSNNGPLATYQTSATVLLNKGGGAFSVVTADSANVSDGCGKHLAASAAGDLTGDGRGDVASSYADNGNDCSKNIEGLELGKATSSNTYTAWQHWNEPQAVGLVIADFNNDNRNDILVDVESTELDDFINKQTYTRVTTCTPSGAGPHLCTPAANSTHGSSVNLQAVGAGVTGTVRLMELWIDGKKIGDYPGSLLNQTLTLAAGAHTATVIQLEYNGQSWRTPKTHFNVN